METPEQRLYPVSFVPMPIGNRSDITQRALNVLSRVDTICCEDTRHSSPLLQHWEIRKPLLSFHEHNEKGRAEEIAQRAAAGETFAIISDAGMPGISDPGYRLLQTLTQAEISYTVLPGPLSLLTALIGSAFPSDAFYFGGFLPIKKGKRQNTLSQALTEPYTSLFLESPHRLPSTLEILVALDPFSPLCVARELTKTFETYHRGTSKELQEYFLTHPPKGEIVLVIGGINFPRLNKTKEASEE